MHAHQNLFQKHKQMNNSIKIDCVCIQVWYTKILYIVFPTLFYII